MYNVEQYLGKCLDSLVNQTLEDIEILVVNDGSTDKSQTVIEEYKKEYPDKIHCFEKTNGGVSDARNFAIKRAKGEYLGFVDGDDWVEHEMYQSLYEKAAATGADVVVCGLNRVTCDDKNNVIKSSKSYITDEHLFGVSVYEAPPILRASRAYSCNKIFRRELWEGFSYPVGKYFEDDAIIYNVLSQANRIDVVNECFYNYLIGRVGATTSSLDRRIFDVFDACDSIINHFKKIGRYEEMEEVLCGICILHIQTRYSLFKKTGNVKVQLEYVDRAFDYLDNNFPAWKQNQYYLKSRCKAFCRHPGTVFDTVLENRIGLKSAFVFNCFKKRLKRIWKKLKKSLLKKSVESTDKAAKKKKKEENEALSNQDLRELQMITLDLFKRVVTFCEEHNLRYYMAEGSLLGAVRHQGFIPWDDDLDIAMPRKDYERFIGLWGKNERNGCRLYHSETYAKYHLPFAKIALVEPCKFIMPVFGKLNTMKHVTGPHIDIFPLDETEPLGFGLYRKLRKARKYRNILLVKCGYFLKKKYRIRYFWGKFLPYGVLQKKINDIFTGENGKNAGYIANFASSYVISREIFAADMFEPARTVDFEGMEVTIPAKAEEMLTTIYGDYMKLPPVEERVCRHKMNISPKK